MSSKGMQYITRPLRALTWATGAPDTINLGEQLPTTLLGRLAHLAGIFFRVQATAYTAASAAPTIVQMNNVVSNMVFKDGFNTRFSGGGFNLLRVHEMLENGALVNPDPPNNGSGPTFVYGRYLPLGINNFAGNPSDFIMPAAAMKTATIDLIYGTLANIAASAATINIQPIAVMCVLDNELRIPPLVERAVWPINKKGVIQGRALYASAGLLNSLSYDAIAAGIYGNLSLLTGSGDVAPVEAGSLEKIFHALMRSGQATQVHGEPVQTLDVNPRAMNPATPTALQAADSVVAPVVFSPPGSRISKLLFGVDGSIAVDWTGTASSAYVVGTRIVAQPKETVGAITARALDVLGLSLDSSGIKTLGKHQYKGPRADFMPWQANTK